jgi:hypothetical protein
MKTTPETTRRVAFVGAAGPDMQPLRRRIEMLGNRIEMPKQDVVAALAAEVRRVWIGGGL